MENLQDKRANAARPLINTGVDLWGPIWIDCECQGKKPQRAYLAVFGCFSRKAVLMEVVTDCTL